MKVRGFLHFPVSDCRGQQKRRENKLELRLVFPLACYLFFGLFQELPDEK